VRGFKDNTLGPRSDPDEDPTGGNLKLAASAELIFPFPLATDSKSVRTSAFVDAGNVFDTRDENFDAGELRYSAGVSLVWISPIGPLSFSVAEPLNPEKDDDIQRFQFSIGTLF
jgi:outer membrane protein insertion porin family